MPSLKKWLRKKLLGKKEETVLTKPPLPFLPIQRPNVLTPSPSQEDLLSSIDNYGIFHRLPHEIRRAILIEAFGGRTLHVDLSHDYPLVRKPERRTTTSTHCGLGSSLTRNSKRRRTWQWFGCVCHRPDHWPDGSPHGTPFPKLDKIGVVDGKSRPDQDVCLSGVANDGGNSECGPPGEEDRCFIGAMGWLLACRQAYADGIDVLFATNTFHIGSSDLLQHLPSLLLPQRLSRIQSLEILWFKGHTRGASSPTHALCQMIPRALPHVRQLAITLECSIGQSQEFVASSELPDPVILGPIEDMVRTLGPWREFNVTIPLRAWLALSRKYGALYRPNFKIEWHNTCMEGRFWKLLGPGDELGYWICSGRFDDQFRSVLC